MDAIGADEYITVVRASIRTIVFVRLLENDKYKELCKAESHPETGFSWNTHKWMVRDPSSLRSTLSSFFEACMRSEGTPTSSSRRNAARCTMVVS